MNEWLCKYRYRHDKAILHCTVFNNCDTFKQLRRWWRINKTHNMTLIGATQLTQPNQKGE